MLGLNQKDKTPDIHVTQNQQHSNSSSLKVKFGRFSVSIIPASLIVTFIGCSVVHFSANPVTQLAAGVITSIFSVAYAAFALSQRKANKGT